MTRSDWIGIIGVIIGLIGIITGYIFYEHSIAEKEPMFFIHPERTSLINTDSLKNTKIRITRVDGMPINSNVTALRFFFWNNGKAPIRASDVYQTDPLTFYFEKNTEILDVKILKVSRPKIVNAELKVMPDVPVHSLRLTFDTLEENDGLSVQIIYAGSNLATFSLSGTILGVKKINNDSINDKFKSTKNLLIFQWVNLIPLICIYTYLYTKVTREIIKKDKSMKYLFISMIILLFFLVIVTSIGTYQFYTTGLLRSIIENNVPISIR